MSRRGRLIKHLSTRAAVDPSPFGRYPARDVERLNGGEVADTTARRDADPGPAVREHRSGRANPVRGRTGDIALLVVFNSVAYFNGVQQQVSGNWEAVSGRHTSPPIEFTDLEDKRLDAFRDSGELSAGSVLAIERVRAILLGNTQ